MAEQTPYDVVIVGSGPAGLTAALYTSRARLKTVVIGGLPYGGQLMNTTVVENYPGFVDGIMGPELMNNMLKQAQRFGAEVVFENAVAAEVGQSPFTITTDAKKSYSARSIIFAQGASSRKLGLPSEEKFFGHGVATCAVCDAALYKGKIAAVVGGGDTAVEDSLALAKFAQKVYVIHRRGELRASKVMQEKILKHDIIEIIWNTQVQEVLGDQKVTGLRLETTDPQTGTVTQRDLLVDGMFLAIGHIPNTTFLQGVLPLDEHGFIITKNEVLTDIPGVFVAGDIMDRVYMQAVTAAGSGCKAAIMTERFLNGIDPAQAR